MPDTEQLTQFILRQVEVLSAQMQSLGVEVRAECGSVAEQMNEQHLRLRHDMDLGFTRVTDSIGTHAKEDTSEFTKINGRVTTLEERLDPVRTLVFSFVALVLIGVVGGLLALVIRQ